MAKQRINPAEGPVKSTRSALREAVNSTEIAALAYHLWQARGCPVGSPEIDWFEAEQQLHRQARDGDAPRANKPLLMRRSGA